MRKEKTKSMGVETGEALAASLLAITGFSSSNDDELIDYMSEHLYIQSVMSLPRNSSEADVAKTRFYNTCEKIYRAADIAGKREAIRQMGLQLAL